MSWGYQIILWVSGLLLVLSLLVPALSRSIYVLAAVLGGQIAILAWSLWNLGH